MQDVEEPELRPITSRKSVALKRTRTIVISAVALLLLLIGAGVGYVWYIGQSGPASTATAPTPVRRKVVSTAPAAPPANARVGIGLESFASPSSAGQNSSISIQTTAGATCSIVVSYGSTTSTDSGLTNKVADEYGVVSWSWTVSSSVKPGSYPVTINCHRDSQSAMYAAKLEVVQQ